MIIIMITITKFSLYFCSSHRSQDKRSLSKQTSQVTDILPQPCSTSRNNHNLRFIFSRLINAVCYLYIVTISVIFSTVPFSILNRWIRYYLCMFIYMYIYIHLSLCVCVYKCVFGRLIIFAFISQGGFMISIVHSQRKISLFAQNLFRRFYL
jgi:hypothetical protein